MRKSFVLLAAGAALASSAAFADDPACAKTLTPEVVAALGPAVGWLKPGQTVHTPAGLTVMGMPVKYVIATHADGTETGPVTQLDYRLQGISKPFGQRYPVDLRKAFDKGFPANCENTSCEVSWKATTAGQLTNASLTEGDFSLPKEARGDGVSLIKADLNLANADPVFLDCAYQPQK